MDIGVSTFVFSYHSIGKKTLFVATVKIGMMLAVCSLMLINDFTGLHERNVYDICFIQIIELMDYSL